jgi:hypothetical protein
MKLSQFTRMCMPVLLTTSAVTLLAVTMSAQVQTKSSTETGQAIKEVKVERGEVVYISGSDVVVKMEDGTIRDFPSVPESARIMVNGKELGVHDLKPGMKLERTITTTSTPRMVTTVQTVTGTIWQIAPPTSVTLTLEDGTNQQFTIPKGQEFKVNGETVDAFGLKKGMRISATKLTEVPETVVTQERKVTGTLPPPPSPPPANMPVLIVLMRQVAPPSLEGAAAKPAPTELPKTASHVPLMGLVGLVCLSLSLGLGMLRRLWAAGREQ